MIGDSPVAAEAIRWSARLHAGDMSAAEHAELLAWRRAHPEHEIEFQAQQMLSRAVQAMPDDAIRRLYGGELPERPRLGRRRALRAGALLLCAGAAGAAAWGVGRGPGRPAYAAQWSTRKGERRSVSLSEGSVLELNTDTQADVAFFDDRRVVTLTRGEVLFDIRPDAARPFFVEAGPATVQVTGARFNVRRTAQDVHVAVEQGVVEVRGGPWWHRSRNVLNAGQGTLVDADGRQPGPQAVNLSAELAWVNGRLVFRNASLATVVDELNRYLAQPLRLANDRVGRLRLTASFKLDDPAGIVEALPGVLPVVLRRLQDGGAVLDLKPGSA
ncbi:FecR family protein [Achromobacter arsenitoxydans]|uniref:FecR family protein n=1 Tax=Achromobacter arsenitoxydans SY8 TaxID=477184 RepID=H0FAV6_9BURK|nr:FecR domain-containing protein [Achromobacter arsenitoxydans]EHK64624.1 FecR family protein [Achromobacter arsenitoxydans SY8]